MRGRVTCIAVAFCAALTIACGGRNEAVDSSAAPDGSASVAPGEAAGTSGTTVKQITISGCVARVPPSGYELTSFDDQLASHEGATASHHRDDPDTRATDANRGGEQERLRYAQNPSANLGRYRLTGRADMLGAHVNHEVEIRGDVMAGDRKNETPSTLKVQSIKATGRTCGKG
jgi:hypothetical protein